MCIRDRYYLARLLAGQKLRGKEYEQMKAAWLILIADYPFFPRSGIVTDETEMSLRTMQIPFTQMTHLSIMETGRTDYLTAKPVWKLSGLERRAILYGNLAKPEKREWIEQICKQDENLRKVVRKMSEMTMDFEAYFRETKAIMACLLYTSYERLAGTGFCHAMAPIIEKLYKDNPEEYKAAVQRHIEFYNTEPHFGGVINGMVIACLFYTSSCPAFLWICSGMGTRKHAGKSWGG